MAISKALAVWCLLLASGAFSVSCSGTTPVPADDAGTASVVCGDNLCAKGDYCCNESCGICAPPGGSCTQQYCGPVGGACSSDADCRTSADYCKGCDCRALGPGQSIPACSGPGVRCLRDPCSGSVAVCENRRCVLKSSSGALQY